MDPVIEVEGLRKEYRRVRGPATVAVDGLDLAVPPGGVFGFLGPNGAGKTTTIRCLLGLVRASGGRCRLLGQEPAGLDRVIGRVGSIVESPAMYPRFSGRRNLELLGDDFPLLGRSTVWGRSVPRDRRRHAPARGRRPVPVPRRELRLTEPLTFEQVFG